MARLRAFGTKARGSVGAVTYYVANGQQIAREKATEVKNPKSSAQSAQRMKMAPAQKMFEALSGIVNHSWQGVKYGTASRQKFMSEAMKQNGGPYVVKGTTTFVPGTYLIADGSLPEIKGSLINDSETFRTNLLMSGDTSRAAIINSIIADNPNFELGDKLTFIAIIGVRTAQDWDAPFTSTFYPILRQIIMRPQLEDGETDDFDEMWDNSLIVNTGYLAIDLATYPYSFGLNQTAAIAVIHSRGQNENNDQRSKSRFAITDKVYNTFYTESAYKLALASYQNTSNAPLGAEWYLNNFPAGTIGRVVAKKWTNSLGHTYDVLALVISEAGANQTFILVDGANRNPIDYTGKPYTALSVDATTPTLPWNRNYLKLFSGN